MAWWRGRGSGSVHVWAERVPGFVGNRSVGMHGYGDRVFLNGDGVIEISLTVQKLLEADHGVIDDFLLRLQLGIKDDVLPVAITHDGHGALAERVDVDAETCRVWRIRTSHRRYLACSNLEH